VVMTTLEVTPSGSFTMQGEGDFQTDPQLGSMELNVTAPQTGTVKLKEVMSGWKVYMSSSTLTATLPAGKTWLSIDLEKQEKSLGIDLNQYSQGSPAQFLDRLRQTGTVTRVGPEQIDGQPTTHYRAMVDMSKLPSGFTKALQQAAIIDFKYRPLQVWVGADGLVRRMTISYSFVHSVGTTSMTITEDLSNYGEAVAIAVPSDDDTVDADKLTQKTGG
jgi:hypothetical protein